MDEPVLRDAVRNIIILLTRLVATLTLDESQAMGDLKELIPTLLQKTEEGKLHWERLSAGSYIARLGDVTFESTSVKNTPQVPLLSSQGERLETVTWNDVGHPFDKQIQDLYDSARRKALGVTEALSTAKRLLDDL